MANDIVDKLRARLEKKFGLPIGDWVIETALSVIMGKRLQALVESELTRLPDKDLAAAIMAIREPARGKEAEAVAKEVEQKAPQAPKKSKGAVGKQPRS